MQLKKLRAFVLASTIFLVRSTGNSFADEPGNQQMNRLEEAVQQLQKQNEALQKEVHQLKERQLDAGIKPADSKSPLSFVIPWGKESKLVLGGFLQANGEYGSVSAFEGRLPGGPNEIFDRFRLRRARINVTGDFLENFDFKLEGDFEQADGTSGNRTDFSGTDLFANWHTFPEANIKVGQWKAPFGLEQLTPDTILFTVERSLVTGALTPERQVGIQLWGKPLATVFPDLKDRLSYAVGVFNGNGRNITINDDNNFMYAGRVEAVPFLGKVWNQDVKWRLGSNGLFSRDAANTTLSPVGNLALQSDGSLLAYTTHSPDQRVAWGVDQTLTIGPFDLIAEFLAERINPTTSAPNFSEFSTHGYYVQGSYFFWNKKLQLVGKWEDFHPGQGASANLSSITGGLNYYIKGDNIKLMLDYIHTWSDFRGQNPTLGAAEFDEALLRLQLLF